MYVLRPTIFALYLSVSVSVIAYGRALTRLDFYWSSDLYSTLRSRYPYVFLFQFGGSSVSLAMLKIV